MCYCSVVSDPCDAMVCSLPTRLLCPLDFSSKNTGVGCCFLLQGIFPIQTSNMGLSHCRPILYHLNHQGSPSYKHEFTLIKLEFIILLPITVLDQWNGVIQLLSCVWIFVTPRTAAHQAPLSFTISWSLLKLISTESMMLSSHLILFHSLLLLPSISHSISFCFCFFRQWIGSSHQVAKVLELVSASELPMNIQGRFPLGMTSMISLLSKGLSRIFSNTTVQKHQFFITQPSAARSGALSWFSACTGSFEGGCHYLHYLHYSFVSGQTTGRNTALPINRKLGWRSTEHSPTNQNKTQFPPQSVSLSGSFQKPLIHQREDRRKTTITDTN